MTDLLLCDLSRRQLAPGEQQRVSHLSEWVQVDEPHPPLRHTRRHILHVNAAHKVCVGFFLIYQEKHSVSSYLAVSVNIKHNCKAEKNI